METKISEFFDTTPANACTLSPKNDVDQFPLKVIKKQALTHDVYRFDIKFADPEWISGIFVGGHIEFMLRLKEKLFLECTVQLLLPTKKDL